ncbi:MAG: YebV family protein, partial [Serratia sp.]|nr:YebV family protein [Serratia sp. (in: enterobacteria)]
MAKSNIKIGSYEIDDAQLSTPEAKGGDMVHIPCK